MFGSSQFLTFAPFSHPFLRLLQFATPVFPTSTFALLHTSQFFSISYVHLWSRSLLSVEAANNYQTFPHAVCDWFHYTFLSDRSTDQHQSQSSTHHRPHTDHRVWPDIFLSSYTPYITLATICTALLTVKA